MRFEAHIKRRICILSNNVYDLTKFGNMILDLRTRRKITQSYIRENHGLHPKTIKNLEYGKTMPNIDTLNRLSDIYRINVHMLLDQCKVDNDEKIDRLMTTLDRISLENKLEELPGVYHDIEEIKNDDHYQTVEYFKKKVDQIEKFAELIKIKNKTDKMSIRASEEKCIEIIKMIHPNFNITNIDNYYFNPLETRVLISLSFSYSRQDRKHLALITMNLCHENAKLHAQSNSKNMQLLIHAKYALAYLNFLHNQHHEAIELCNDAIDLSKDIYNVKLLPNLYFRKGISEFCLDKDTYLPTLKKALNTLDLMDKGEEKSFYLKMLKDRYDIEL